MIKDFKLVEATQMKSPNHGGRLKDPSFIITHYTAGRSAHSSARWLCSPQAKASAHLIIGREGALIQCGDFDSVMWHAGQSEWKGIHGLNSHSIGIELDNPGPVARVNGRWRSLSLGQDYADGDVVELAHELQPHTIRGWVLYSSVQLALLEDICRELVEAYPSIHDVLNHSDVAGGRKLDAGPALDIGVLRSRVFGRGEA